MIDSSLLEPLKGGILFYPCSGDDFHDPLRFFAPYIQHFWFVDKTYFGNEKPKEPLLPVLKGTSNYKLLEKPRIWNAHSVQREEWAQARQERFPWRVPWVQSERYVHIESDQEILIHRRSGYGTGALHHQIESLSVFFYRGDSSGEGGSGTLWLQGRSHRRALIGEVLQKLVPGGLVVTDGSNCPRRGNPYAEFARFHNNHSIEAEATAQVKSFFDKHGRYMTCVGYVGERYGPTLVWQVSQNLA